MDKIDEGKIFTKGKTFRAVAEARARKYRTQQLCLRNYDEYGHRITDEDGNSGKNFLPSLQEHILRAVEARADDGKGVDLKRTTKNLLSSQAMCFNLFVPLNKDQRLTAKLFNTLIGDIGSINDIDYEFTPLEHIFGDQSGKGGVDCDALVRYTDHRGQKGLIVIETKFVETEFSKCGFRKSGQKDKCPANTVVNDDYSNCRYHYKKHYHYWKVAGESELYRMDLLHSKPCPFGGSLWQLWTNLTLAYALAKEDHYSRFYYVVICPRSNTKLSADGQVFDDFKSLLRQPDIFRVLYLDDIGNALKKASDLQKPAPWVNEFVERYCWNIEGKSE
jgi:hypothetical protein